MPMFKVHLIKGCLEGKWVMYLLRTFHHFGRPTNMAIVSSRACWACTRCWMGEGDLVGTVVCLSLSVGEGLTCLYIVVCLCDSFTAANPLGSCRAWSVYLTRLRY